MKEIVLMTDEELAIKIREKEKRGDYMRTEKGQIRLRQRMLELFEYLRLSGYKLPDADPDKLSEVWSEQMSEYIVTYGWDVIVQATKNFVLNDKREYRQSPNASQIIAEAKRIGFNPDVEHARRLHESEVERLEKETDEYVAKELTDEKRRMLMKRYPNIASIIERSVCGD